MANLISKTGITNGGRITANQITQLTDALTGAAAYDLTISGSLNVTGSSPVTGSFSGDGSGLTGVVSSSYSITSSYSNTSTSASYSLTTTTASMALAGNGQFSGSFSGSHTAIILTTVSASLNFADDSAAGTGGVPLGGLYRSGSFIKIRIS